MHEVKKRLLRSLAAFFLVITLCFGMKFLVQAAGADQYMDQNNVDISKCNLTLEQDIYTYTGSEIRPVPILTYGEYRLVEGTDYEVSYSNNIYPEDAVKEIYPTVTITGKGVFESSVDKTFTISPINIEEEGYRLVLDWDTGQYNGISYNVNSFGNIRIYKGDVQKYFSYTVSGAQATNAGTHTVTITAIETSGYTGSISAKWRILPAELNEEAIEFSLMSSSIVYTGSEIHPIMTVRDIKNNKEISSSNYSVTYENNINVGTATVRLTINNYEGTLTRNFEITPYDLTTSNTTLTPGSMSYTGEELKPEIEIRMGQFTNSPVLDPENYILEYSNNIYPGTGQVTITGVKNASGSITKYFNVKKGTPYLKVGDTVIEPNTIPTIELTYLDSVPISTNSDAGFTFNASKNYLSLDADNVMHAVKVNNSSISATFSVNQGTYTKSYSYYVYFKVFAKEITEDMITLEDSTVAYNGQEQKPVPVLSYKDQTLNEGTDYTISYDNNVNVGTATYTITGKGNYTGSITKEFNIIPYDISECEIAFDKEEFSYNGHAIEPKVTVYLDKVSGKVLEEEAYSVSYTENVDPGTGNVSITAKGDNYTGTKEANFTIQKGEASIHLEASQIAIGEMTTVILENNKGYMEFSSNDSDIAYMDIITNIVGKHVGKTSIHVKYNGEGYYEDKELDLDLEVLPHNLESEKTEVTLSEHTYVYDASAKTPEVHQVTYDNKILKEDSDYKVSYINNTNAGSPEDGAAAPQVIIEGINDYKNSVRIAFAIEKAESNISVEKTELTVGESTKINLTRDGIISYNVKDSEVITVDTKNALIYAANAGSVTLQLTMAESQNYKVVTKEVEITVLPKNTEAVKVNLAKTEYTYSGKECTPEVTVTLGDAILIAGTDYDVIYTDNVNAGLATAKVVTKGNYKGTFTEIFSILPYDLADASVKLSKDSYEYTGESLKPEVTLYTDTEQEIPAAAYDLAYTDNVKPGTAKVEITAADPNYTGSTESSYTINKIDPSYTVGSQKLKIGESSKIQIEKAEANPTVTVEPEGILSLNATQYTAIKEGKAIVHVSFAEGDIYKALEGSFEVEVLPDDIEKPESPTNPGDDTTKTPEDQKNIEDIQNILGLTEKQAEEIYKVTKACGVSKETLMINDKVLLSRKSDADIPGSSFKLLQASISKANKKNIVVKWKRVSGADGYMIYGSKCGSNNILKKLATCGPSKLSYKNVNLCKGTYYKYLVVAYKQVGNIKVTIASSPYIHGITKGGKYGMAKSVKITKIGKNKKTSKVTLAVGKKARIYSTEVKQDKKIKKHVSIRYESSNPSIAKVASNGTITAVKKGTCTIYVYAPNGKYKTVKATVK